jgi:hypothetical protein
MSTIQSRYLYWKEKQGNDRHESHDAMINSPDAELLAESECRTTTTGTLTQAEKEENPASSCFTKDTTSFDSDNSNDSSTICVQPRAPRSKDASITKEQETALVSIREEARDCIENHYCPVKDNKLGTNTDTQNDGVRELGDCSVTTHREKEESLELAADALAPDAVAAKSVETKENQALPGTRSHGTKRRQITRQKWGPSDYLDIQRRRSQGETWAQINSAYGRNVCSEFHRSKQRSNPTNTQNRKRRTQTEFMDMEQRRESGESWKSISAIHGDSARTAYINWKYRRVHTEHQRQPYPHTTPEQFAAIHELRVNTRTTWPNIGKRFGLPPDAIRLRYICWKWRQDIGQGESRDVTVNSSDVDLLTGSTECEMEIARSLTRIEKEDSLASSCYMRDTPSFDNNEFDDSDNSDDFDDDSTTVVQPRAFRSKDADLLLCHFES